MSKQFASDNNHTILFADLPDVLAVSDIQQALGIGRAAAYKLVGENKIKHIRIGKIIKIPKPLGGINI
ncbi:helix-turn-helix domain-containing protein [Marasmitruncus massiliensis]|uniref:helix-turn-helix domain-containing protein n=1 Tax=Marasmitruncus massiliensis TaxID=1944642 RepID=UPI000C7CF2BF|nr:helix-turn-helix domain-containing protein [Marasmitruncus massiliensis]